MAPRLVLSAGSLTQASPQILNPFSAQVSVATVLQSSQTRGLPAIKYTLEPQADLENLSYLLTGGAQ